MSKIDKYIPGDVVVEDCITIGNGGDGTHIVTNAGARLSRNADIGNGGNGRTIIKGSQSEGTAEVRERSHKWHELPLVKVVAENAIKIISGVIFAAAIFYLGFN